MGSIMFIYIIMSYGLIHSYFFDGNQIRSVVFRALASIVKKAEKLLLDASS